MDTMPTIGASGSFTVDASFASIIKENEVYTVLAVRSLKEMLPINPLAKVYEKVGLTSADYESDLQANVSIIVLGNQADQKFYVPLDRIVSGPITDGIEYQERVIAFNLGPMPVDENIDALMSDLHDYIFDTLGIDATSKVAMTSAVEQVSTEDSATIEANRASNISLSSTFKTRAETAEALLALKQAYIDQFESYEIGLLNP